MSVCLADQQTAESIMRQINSVREPQLFTGFPSALHRSVEKKMCRLFVSGQANAVQEIPDWWTGVSICFNCVTSSKDARTPT